MKNIDSNFQKHERKISDLRYGVRIRVYRMKHQRIRSVIYCDRDRSEFCTMFARNGRDVA